MTPMAEALAARAQAHAALLHKRETPLASHPRSLITVAAILIGVTWIAVALRVWTRSRMIRSFGWDDISILITNLFFTIFAAAAIVDVDLALNPGVKAYDPKIISAAVEWLLVAETFYVCTVCVFKISLGLFFLRITNAFWYRYIIYVAVFISTIFSVTYMFFAIFQCGVPKSGLDFALKKLSMQCIDVKVITGMGYAHAAVVSATDWTFALLPLPLLRESRMPLRDKISVGFVLILGTIGSVCSLVRFAYLEQLSAKFFDFFDFALWSILEPGIGIVANCLATLRPLVRQIASKETSPRTTCNKSNSSSALDARRGSVRSAMMLEGRPKRQSYAGLDDDPPVELEETESVEGPEP